MNEEKKSITSNQATLLYIVVAFSFFVYVVVSPFVIVFIAKIYEYVASLHPLLGLLACSFLATMYVLWGEAHTVVAEMLRHEYGALENEGDVK